MTVATMVTAHPAVSPYRHSAAVLFQVGVNTLRWLAGAVTVDWESHDAG
jgi:hypothetical protein